MSKNITQALIDIYAAPKQVFNALPEKKGWSWVAFALLLAIQAVAIGWFYAGMSMEWIVEQQIAQVAHSMTPIEIEESKAVMEQMADKMAIISIGSMVVMTPILLGLMAAYLMLVGNPGQKRSYGDWYAISVWSNMPNALNMLGLMLLVLISSEPNLPLDTINYLSLNQLLLGVEPSHAWYMWAESLNLVYVWIIALFSVGLHSWSGYTLRKSVLLAALPFIAVFGLWAILV